MRMLQRSGVGGAFDVRSFKFINHCHSILTPSLTKLWLMT